MKYHTTKSEFFTATLATICFAAISWLLVVHLQFQDPAKLLAEHTFSTLSQGDRGNIVFHTIDRKFLSKITSDQVEISYEGNLSCDVDSITFDEGLFSLIGKLVTGKGTASVQVTNPHTTAHIASIPRNATQSDNSQTVQIPSILQRIGLRVRLQGVGFELSTDRASLNLQDGEMDFLLHKGGSFGSLRMSLPSIQLSNDDLSTVGKGTQIYLEDSGFLYTRIGSLEGSVKGTTFSLKEYRAESRIMEDGLPITLSCQELRVNSKLFSAHSPLISGSFSFQKSEKNLIPGLSIPMFEEGVISLQGMEISQDKFNTTLPTTTISFSRDQDFWYADLATKENDTIHVDTDQGILELKGLRARGQLRSDDHWMGLTLQSPLASFSKDELAVDVTSFQANLYGNNFHLTHHDVMGSLLLKLKENSLSSHIDLHGFMEEGTYAVTGTLESARTNLFGETFDGAFDGEWNFTNPQGSMRFSLDSQDKLHINALYEKGSDGNNSYSVNALINGLPLSAFDQTWRTYLPLLTPYYDEKTTTRGNFSLQGGDGKKGRVQYEVSLSDLKFGQFRFRAGSTGNGALNATDIAVDSITVGVQNYRLEFQGGIKIGEWVPNGSFLITDTDDGRKLLQVDMRNTSAHQYVYQATSDQFPDFIINGNLATSSDIFSSNAMMVVKDVKYPISWRYTISAQHLTGSTPKGVYVESDIKNPLTLNVSVNNLALPETKRLQHSSIGGNLSIYYENQKEWNFKAENLRLNEISLGGRTYSFAGNGTITPDSFDFTDLQAMEGNSTFTGFLHYHGTPLIENVRSSLADPFTLSFHIDDGDEQRTDLYVSNYEDRMETMVDMHHIELDRFLTQGGDWIGNLSLIGSSSEKDAFKMTGTVSITGNETEMQGTVEFDGNRLSILHLDANQGNNRIQDGVLELNLRDGAANLSGSFTNDLSFYTLENRNTSFDFSLAAHFSPFDKTLQDLLPERRFSVEQVRSFLNMEEEQTVGEKLKNHLLGDEIGIDLAIKNMRFLGFPLEGMEDASINFTYKDGFYTAQGSILNGYFDSVHKEIDLQIDPIIGFGGHLKGSTDLDQLAIKFNDAYFELRLFNRFLATPITHFNEGSLKGKLYIEGPASDPNMFGQLACDSLNVWAFYVPDYDIIVKNALFSVDNSEIKSVKNKCFAVRHDTGETVTAQAQIEVQMDGLSLAGFNVTVWLQDKPIEFYCPVPEANVEVSGYMKGWFKLNKSAGSRPLASGEATVNDVLIGIGGLTRCPDWYKAANISVDFLLTNGKNNRIIYPNIDNPLLSFTLKEEEKFRFSFDNQKKKASVDGTLVFRSGEIFYFQKDFYVTEGSMALRTLPSGGVQPFLNLRARLRDFDGDGNPVDIYLNLADSTLDNLNPTFESTPLKSTEEIMSILGGSILPGTEEGGGTLYRMASVASMATDVAERMGWIQSSPMTNLSETIRKNLGLDVFSFRSQIMQNFLLDAIPGSDSARISPLARYLNNTSVFMGKYLSDDMFLQGMLHLSAVNPRSLKPNDSPFLVNDLSLRFEFSFEWANPLCTFTVFSKPNELSLMGFLDRIGLSVTKRIVLF